MKKKLFKLPIDIVSDHLCVRCGACYGLCPKNLIHVDNQFYPSMSAKNRLKCTECGSCMQACPSDVNFNKLYLECFRQLPKPTDVVGVVQNAYVGYSTNEKIRYMGSSGGVVTELLLFLLRERIIDQALVCGVNDHNPLIPKPYLAKTEEEIINAAQSKYSIAPQMSLLGEIIRSKVKTAIVGLPCQIHAFRKMQSFSKKRTANVKLVIGLACHRTLETKALSKLLEVSHIRPETVKRVNYRSGEKWPGGIRVYFKTGGGKCLVPDCKDAFNYLRMFYSPERCLTCIDFSAELADLAVMDPWIRDNSGGYMYSQNYSMILIRNNKAQSYLNRAVADGCVYMEDILQGPKLQSNSVLSQNIIDRSQLKYFAKLKKRIVPARIKRYQTKGKPYPDYQINFPPTSLKDRILERFDCLTRLPGKYEWSRDLGMRISFSKFGTELMRLRNEYKSKKAMIQNRMH